MIASDVNYSNQDNPEKKAFRLIMGIPSDQHSDCWTHWLAVKLRIRRCNVRQSIQLAQSGFRHLDLSRPDCGVDNFVFCKNESIDVIRLADSCGLCVSP